MNKNHRVIWNRARNCLVVAGENASSRGGPNSTKKGIAAAVAALLLAPGIAAADTCSGVNPVNGAMTTTQCYTDGDISIAQTGSVAVTGESYVDAIVVDSSSYDQLFLIAGAVSATASGTSGAGAFGVDFLGSLGGTLGNSGDIAATALVQNASASGEDRAAALIVGEDLNGTVENSGSIVAETSVDVVGDGLSSYTIASGEAAGVVVGNDLNGTFTNTGTIGGESATTATSDGTALLESDAESFAGGAGVVVKGDLNGTLRNGGTISGAATADATVASTDSDYYDYDDADADAESAGVVVDGDLNGTLTNNASITSSSTASATTTDDGFDGSTYAYSDSDATGVAVYGGLNGTMTNAGSITAHAQSDSSGTSGYVGAYAYAGGVYVGDDAAGVINNSGSITATSVANRDESDGYFYGYAEADSEGIEVDGDLNNLTNSGSIAANATATSVSSSADAYASGIYVGEDLDGELTNSRTITAVATADATSGSSGEDYANSWTDANGIWIAEDVNGTLRNSGTIDATATSTVGDDSYGASQAGAWGVYVSDNLNGTLVNSNIIRATANGEDASAAGVYVGGVLGADGALTNSGTISATASTEGQSAEAWTYAEADGVRLDSGLDGTLTNHGAIGAIARGLEAYATGVGIGGGYGEDVFLFVPPPAADGGLNGTLDNFGTITATAEGEEAYAFGLRVGAGFGEDYESSGLNGTLNNFSTISATATGELAAAIGVAVGVAPGMALGEDMFGSGGNLDGTFNNAGTISATANGLSGIAIGVAIAGEVAEGATFTNSGDIVATASGGFGIAAGVLTETLDGVLTNSGSIRAAGDALAYAVLAPEGAGTIDNRAGGLLEGNLMAGGSINVINDGTIDFGASAMPILALGDSAPLLPGAGMVGGNYTQGATGLLKITAVDTMTYGRLLVGGAASLADGTGIHVKVDPQHALADGDKLEDVILAGGGLTMSTLKVTDNVLALNFVASDDGEGGLDLTTRSTGLTTAVAAVQGTGRGSAGGAAGLFDQWLDSPDQQPGEIGDFVSRLASSGSSGQVAALVSQTLPLLSGGVARATFGAMHGVNRVVQARQDVGRGRASGDAFLGDKNVWLKPFGSWADQDSDNGTIGYDARTRGVVLGVDGELSSAYRLGLAFTYARSDVDSGASAVRQDADVNTYGLTLYGNRAINASTDLSFNLGYGRHENEGSRVVSGVGTARSDYDSWSVTAGLGLAHTIVLSEQTSFIPSVRAEYARLSEDGYRERGAGLLNLAVDENDTEEFIVSADAKLSHTLSQKLVVTGNLGAGYDFINERTSLTSSFAGASGVSFATPGVDPSPWLVRGGVGVIGKPTELWEVSARYDAEVREDFNNQTVSVKLRRAF